MALFTKKPKPIAEHSARERAEERRRRALVAIAASDPAREYVAELERRVERLRVRNHNLSASLKQLHRAHVVTLSDLAGTRASLTAVLTREAIQ